MLGRRWKIVDKASQIRSGPEGTAKKEIERLRVLQWTHKAGSQLPTTPSREHATVVVTEVTLHHDVHKTELPGTHFLSEQRPRDTIPPVIV